ncbi:hypothetical protein JVT61DRAFT_6226 [Boletus reticuloceps]|uniref:Uncharacterized protein n=1 Tax=Boletus reticuloceps TaxID=495285 RepID=A0A8I3A835_9AGAM|nr:hypothetical protein JVT61DRAFT_6226 [Boletus reticuloceps]
MSKSASDTDADFYVKVHRRMVESGEWDRYALVSLRPARVLLRRSDPRILRLLASKLSEHGWVDEVRHRAKGHHPCLFLGDVKRWVDGCNYTERARSMDVLSFRLMLEEIMLPVQGT